MKNLFLKPFNTQNLFLGVFVLCLLLISTQGYAQEKISEAEKLLAQAQTLTGHQKLDIAILICEKALVVAEKETVKKDSIKPEILHHTGRAMYHKGIIIKLNQSG